MEFATNLVLPYKNLNSLPVFKKNFKEKTKKIYHFSLKRY